MSDYLHHFEWTVPASSEHAFAALTERDALTQWFCEFAEVDLQLGGDFQFWGKHTLDTASQAQANQKVTQLDPPTQFGFSWNLLGCGSRVTFSLSASDDGAGTTVSGKHQFSGQPSAVRAEQLVDDLWRMNGGNFRAYLDGGDGICLPDYNDPAPEVRLSILIDAPRASVFKALTTPEIMTRWLGGDSPVVELKPDGAYSYGWNYDVDGRSVSGGPTRILEVVENEKLVTDWPDWRGDASVPDQTITWLLEDEGSGTRLTLVHTGFVRPVDVCDYPFGWREFMEELRKTVERPGPGSE